MPKDGNSIAPSGVTFKTLSFTNADESLDNVSKVKEEKNLLNKLQSNKVGTNASRHIDTRDPLCSPPQWLESSIISLTLLEIRLIYCEIGIRFHECNLFQNMTRGEEGEKYLELKIVLHILTFFTLLGSK